jgi:hypothetical protein
MLSENLLVHGAGYSEILRKDVPQASGKGAMLAGDNRGVRWGSVMIVMR